MKYWDNNANLPIKADSFKLFSCSDRKCGVHVVGMVRGTPICDIVIEKEHIPDIIKHLQGALYRIAAMKDDAPWSGSGRAGNGSDM